MGKIMGKIFVFSPVAVQFFFEFEVEVRRGFQKNDRGILAGSLIVVAALSNVSLVR